MRRIPLVALLILALSFLPVPSVGRADPVRVAECGVPSVALLLNMDRGTMGTAFRVEGGWLTAGHVALGGSKFYLTQGQDQHGPRAPATLLTVDDIEDLALMGSRLEAPVLRVADSDPVMGSAVGVVGYPQGIGPGLSVGVLSGYYQGEFQSTAGVEPGSSGSPLLSDDCTVVGLVTQRSDAFSYGVPGSTIREFLGVKETE